jgi:hypothetical protein
MDYKIKYIGNPDGIDLKTYVPKVKDEFCFEVEIEIQFGKHEKNVELYSFDVGSPKGISVYYADLLKIISKTISKPKITFVEPTIVMEVYEYDAMLKFLLEYLYKIKGRNRLEQSLILSRQLYWESLDEDPKSYPLVFKSIKKKVR